MSNWISVEEFTEKVKRLIGISPKITLIDSVGLKGKAIEFSHSNRHFKIHWFSEYDKNDPEDFEAVLHLRTAKGKKSYYGSLAIFWQNIIAPPPTAKH